MQALILNRYNGPLELSEVLRPTPSAGRVLVRIAASGLNPLDTKIRSGSAAHAKHPVPLVLGMLLQNRAAARGNPSLCLALCQRLLYTGTAESVLRGASLADPDSSIIDPAQPVIRYRVEKRDSCPAVTLPDGVIRQSELNIFNKRQLLDDVMIRIAAGKCLIAETATLAQSDLIVVNEVLRDAHQPSMRDRWKPGLDTLSARRLTVYRIRDGLPVQLSRETSMTACPVFTPLLIGLLTGDPIDIELGILRVPKKNPREDIGTFFEKVFGLNAIPVAARATIAGGGIGRAGSPVTKGPSRNMSRLLEKSAHASTDQSMGELERLLREALADPTLPPNSPKLILANKYFESIARNSTGDVPLLAGLISDRRVTDVSDALRRAVIALGPASAPLAGPLLNRIDAEIPGGQLNFDRLLVGYVFAGRHPRRLPGMRKHASQATPAERQDRQAVGRPVEPHPALFRRESRSEGQRSIPLMIPKCGQLQLALR